MFSTYLSSSLPGRCIVGLSLSGHQSVRWDVEAAIVGCFLLYSLVTVCTYVCKILAQPFQLTFPKFLYPSVVVGGGVEVELSSFLF